MADVSTVHGVTASRVLEGLPYPEGRITETGTGVTLPKIREHIQDAAGELNSFMKSRGIDPANLGADEARMAVTGILAYARWKCLAVSPAGPDRLSEDYKAEWEQKRSFFQTLKGGMGDSDPPQGTTYSSVDPDAERDTIVNPACPKRF